MAVVGGLSEISAMAKMLEGLTKGKVEADQTYCPNPIIGA